MRTLELSSDRSSPRRERMQLEQKERLIDKTRTDTAKIQVALGGGGKGQL